jgi:hypothetical protein
VTEPPLHLTGGADEALATCLEKQALPLIAGDHARVSRLELAPTGTATSYDAQVLTVVLADGSSMRVFVKDFGFSRLVKDDPGARRSRELHVYRDLLKDAQVGTPTYYGSVWDEETGRFTLLLELVEGTLLRDSPFEHWVLAAGWLACLQAAFARHPERFRRSPWLLRHDREYFAGKAESALWAMERISPRAADRLRSMLCGYDDLIALGTGDSPTIVHGNFRPKNVIVAPDAARVCVVDWEVAALGAPLYDLALLADGYSGERLERLVEAYERQAHAHGLSLPARDRMFLTLDFLCLHRVVKALSRALEKGFREREVSGYLDHGEALRARLT